MKDLPLNVIIERNLIKYYHFTDEISELKLQLDRDGSRSPKAGFHVALEELKLQLAVKTEALKAAKQTEEDFREQIVSWSEKLC